MTTKTHEERENWRTAEGEPSEPFEWTDPRVLLILMFMALATSIASVTVNGDITSGLWWEGWLQNFSTELFGAFSTFLLIETIVRERRQKEDDDRAREAYQKQLLREVRSRSNDTAVSAVDALREEGWLLNGAMNWRSIFGANLRGADLWNARLECTVLGRANLQEADLTRANLYMASLVNANLQRAKLESADLWKAILMGANLQEADLTSAVLDSAHLEYANCKGANFWRTEMYGTNLRDANLEGARFYEVMPNEETVLPDGTRWTHDIDINKFIDPEHPEFWQPDWAVEKAKDIDQPEATLTEDLLADVTQRLASLERELSLLRAAQKVNGRVPGPPRLRR